MAKRHRRFVGSSLSASPYYRGNTDWYVSETFHSPEQIEEYKRVANTLKKIRKFNRRIDIESRKAIIEDQAYAITKYPDGPAGKDFYRKHAKHSETR